MPGCGRWLLPPVPPAQWPPAALASVRAASPGPAPHSEGGARAQPTQHGPATWAVALTDVSPLPWGFQSPQGPVCPLLHLRYLRAQFRDHGTIMFTEYFPLINLHFEILFWCIFNFSLWTLTAVRDSLYLIYKIHYHLKSISFITSSTYTLLLKVWHLLI